MTPIIIFTGIITFFLFVITYLVATLLRNNGIVDILWGLGLATIAVTSYIFSLGGFVPRLVLFYVLIWGIRLAWHIFARARGRGEDYRYAAWRTAWGQSWVIRSFLQIYLLQWALMQLVSLPILYSMTGRLPIPPYLQYLGMGLWLTGFFFEAVGDYQLARFKRHKRNKGKLMTTGLWSLTRHPNYFGEAVLWWGIACLAYGVSGNLLAFIGPLTINFLLLYVSGIPMLEKKYEGRADWRAYAEKTSAFFPLPPKRG